MFLDCFLCTDKPPKIVAGQRERDWMNGFSSRFPYRCLPLTMANTTGWEILCPADIEVSWNGGDAISDLTVRHVEDRNSGLPDFAVSHFSHGILTFHTGYLFRTPVDIALMVSGAPNHIKDGIQPLSGLVETEWLPLPFTMNWRMTRPGTVYFSKDEPFCFIQMIEHKKMDEVVPTIRRLQDDPELMNRYENWSNSRDDFIKALHENDEAAIQQGWQRNYFLGQELPQDSCPAHKVASHINKRRLKAPLAQSVDKVPEN